MTALQFQTALLGFAAFAISYFVVAVFYGKFIELIRKQMALAFVAFGFLALSLPFYAATFLAPATEGHFLFLGWTPGFIILVFYEMFKDSRRVG